MASAETEFGMLPTGMGGETSVGAQRERAVCQLEEFEIEVESRLAEMAAEIKKLTTRLQRDFRVQLFKVPKAVRGMKMSDFKREYGGAFSAVQKKAMDQKLMDANSMPPPPPSTARRSKRSKAAVAAPEDAVGSAAKRLRTSRSSTKPAVASEPATVRRTSRRTTRSMAVAAEPEMPVTVERASRRSTRQSTIQATAPRTASKRQPLTAVNKADDFKTPMPSKKRGGKVPAATPAFDPRLPTTPFVRQPRKGESFISLNGSPVAVDTKCASMIPHDRASIITVPLKDGKCVQLDPTDTTLRSVKDTLSKKNKKETVDKLQELMNQLQSCMDALA